MKTFVTFAFAIAIAVSALPARAESHGNHQGHDTTTHDCAAMHKMDKTKMDMNDPAMKAMHDKCMKQMHGHGDNAEGSGHSEGQDTPLGSAPPQHDHENGGN